MKPDEIVELVKEMCIAYLLGEQGKAIELYPRKEYVVDAWKLGYEVFEETNREIV